MRKTRYQAPPAERPVVGVLGGTREDLRTVAVCQKCITLCVLVYVVVWVAAMALQSVIPPMPLFMLIWVALAAILAGVVCVFVLSTKVYGVGVGILLGIPALIPVVGLIVLLALNAKATAVLRQNGHHVGFWGADLSEFPEP